MKRNITRFVVFSIAILSAELVVQFLTRLIPSYRQPGQPYLSTLIRMGLILVVFYPTFLLFKDVMKHISERYVKKTKKMTGGWWRGIIACFTGALVLLLWGFAHVWYDRNLPVDAWHWLVNLF